jgi:hypothetical protein
MKIMEKLAKLLKSPSRPQLTDSDKNAVEKALVGKTIEHVTQVGFSDGWFIMYLKMTDGSAIHFVSSSPQNMGRIRVQLNNLDGTKSNLPIIPRNNP